MLDISFIGAGNVAFRLSLVLNEKGFSIKKIFNQTAKHRNLLINVLKEAGSNVSAAESVEELFSSDIVFIAVNDNAIEEIVNNIAEVIEKKRTTDGKLSFPYENLPLFLHTSGATDITIFKPLEKLGCKFGVFYPLMTLRKNKDVNFKGVPILLESPFSDVRKMLYNIALALGEEHYFKNSKERLQMHIAAVFTSNFVNYLLDLAFGITGRDHSLLLPSAIESVRNCFLLDPASVLTGPAKRKDFKTIEKHLKLLDEMGLKEQKEVYEYLTNKIIEKQSDKD